MKRKTIIAFALAAVLSLGLVACGNGSAKTGAATNSAAPQMKGSSSSGRESETVTIKDFKFAPATLDVTRGTTVVWTNQDGFLHTVTSGGFSGSTNKPDGMFDNKLPKQGAVAEFTFDKVGTYTYFCRQHNVMNATINVKEA